MEGPLRTNDVLLGGEKKNFESGLSWHGICHSPRIRCSIGVRLLIIHQSSSEKKGQPGATSMFHTICWLVLKGLFPNFTSEIF